MAMIRKGDPVCSIIPRLLLLDPEKALLIARPHYHMLNSRMDLVGYIMYVRLSQQFKELASCCQKEVELTIFDC